MLLKISRIKAGVLFFFLLLALFAFNNNRKLTPSATANFAGPPPSNTGAPGEASCNNCHIDNAGNGQFLITAPANYTPGQTYQIVVRHVNPDTSRRRWGFQITALAGTNMAGTFASLSPNTQIVSGNGRDYMEHTAIGTFVNQTGGCVWTFNWTAPATNVGNITFYAAGNQANNDSLPEGDQLKLATAVSQAPAAPPRKSTTDFDGDGKSDPSIFRPSVGEWYYSSSLSGNAPGAQFGASTDKIAPADYTGDGKADFAFFRPSDSNWYILRSDNQTFFAFPFGANGDIPAPGDFDGDGKADVAIFRPSSGLWAIQRSSDNGTTIEQFGANGDYPVVANYDGDLKADISVYRPSAGEWFVRRSSDGSFYGAPFGAVGDLPIQGDYTGDGKADVAVFRPSSGFWYVLRSEDQSFFGSPFGNSTDIPTIGDYDGDGKNDFAVFRPSTGNWFIQRSTAGFLAVPFGIATDKPAPTYYLP